MTRMIKSNQVEQCVMSVLQAVFRNKGTEPPLIDLNTLIDRSLGLDSLDWAEVAVRLELELGVDPFQSGATGELRTMADLVELCKATGPLSS